jgi:hypothetical protein
MPPSNSFSASAATPQSEPRLPTSDPASPNPSRLASTPASRGADATTDSPFASTKTPSLSNAAPTITRKTPLRRTEWRPTRKPLRSRSKKTAALYVKRRQFVADTLSQRPVCEARWDHNCTRRSVDVHEILPRSQGGRIVGGDSSEYLAVCRWCHDQIETHPQEAHDRGFRRWSWETTTEEQT